jgi:acetyl esterase/lipase
MKIDQNSIVKKPFIFIVLTCIYVSCIGQQYSKKWTDVNYAGDGKGYHSMDIYLPVASKEKHPVVVYIYGSAWFSNNMKGSDMNTIGNALLRAGYAVVVPNHRSSNDSLFPAQINDIKAVIRYIRGNCDKFSLDTTFIGISGSSSGGHLAALTGTSNHVRDFVIDSLTTHIEGNLGEYGEYSSKVNAVCDWFGPTDLLKIDSCRNSSAYAEGQSPEEILIGCSKKACKSKFVPLNPITFIDSTTPPFLVFHGDADNVVPYCESQLLYQALQSSGVPGEFILVPGGQHYTGVHTNTNINKMVDFFDSVSKNNTNSINKLPAENSLNIYTNSALNILYIDGILEDSFDYEIIDAAGKVISFDKALSNRIDIASLNHGIYILKLHLKNEKSYTGRFVK